MRKRRTLAELAREIMKILLEREKVPIRYADLGKMIEYPPQGLGRPLGLVSRYCSEKGLKPLPRLVVNAQGLPGRGYIPQGGSLSSDLRDVQEYDWAAVRLPTVEELKALQF